MPLLFSLNFNDHVLICLVLVFFVLVSFGVLFVLSSLGEEKGRRLFWGYMLLFPAVLILACASSSPAFLMMYSAYKLNKQGDNISLFFFLIF